jgi:hypothetical protein
MLLEIESLPLDLRTKPTPTSLQNLNKYAEAHPDINNLSLVVATVIFISFTCLSSSFKQKNINFQIS